MVVKIKGPHYNTSWKQVICTKYRDNTPLSKISPLWKDIIALNQLGQIGIFLFDKIGGMVTVH
jgi:hypothetical protein